MDGFSLGAEVSLGAALGYRLPEGMILGACDTVGKELGAALGSSLGAPEGDRVGPSDGALVGLFEATIVG